MSPSVIGQWIGWLWIGVIVALLLTTIASLLNALNIIDIDRFFWSIAAKRLGLVYVGKNQQRIVHLHGVHRERFVNLYHCQQFVSLGINFYWRSWYQIDIELKNTEVEFRHQLRVSDLYRPRFSISAIEYMNSLKQDVPILARLAMKYPAIMDSVLDLRGYDLLRLRGNILTYKYSDDKGGHRTLRRIRTLLAQLSQLADAVEAVT